MWGILGPYLFLRLMFKLLPLALIFAAVFMLNRGDLCHGALIVAGVGLCGGLLRRRRGHA